jgi:hypothetical protein
MSGVVRFERPVASRAAIASLVTLGYYSKQNDTALTPLNRQSNACGAISVTLA